MMNDIVVSSLGFFFSSYIPDLELKKKKDSNPETPKGADMKTPEQNPTFSSQRTKKGAV